MQRVSARTLVLMLELLMAVVAIQYMATVRSVRVSAVWLAGNCAASLAAPAEVNDCTVQT